MWLPETRVLAITGNQEIDKWVYNLYELTDDGIKIIEETAS